MTNYAKINHADRTIVMDRAFAKNAQIVGSKEYEQLQACRKDYPNYSVVQRKIKRNAAKECYRGLTYVYMEEYIASHEHAAIFRRKYDELRLLAECHSIRYPTIKKWFLNTYPEVARFGMENLDVREVPLTDAA